MVMVVWSDRLKRKKDIFKICLLLVIIIFSAILLQIDLHLHQRLVDALASARTFAPPECSVVGWSDWLRSSLHSKKLHCRWATTKKLFNFPKYSKRARNLIELLCGLSMKGKCVVWSCWVYETVAMCWRRWSHVYIHALRINSYDSCLQYVVLIVYNVVSVTIDNTFWLTFSKIFFLQIINFKVLWKKRMKPTSFD